jgi:hypothetical protein
MEDGKRPVDFLLNSPPPRVFFTHLGFDALPKSIPENAKVSFHFFPKMVKGTLQLVDEHHETSNLAIS